MDLSTVGPSLLHNNFFATWKHSSRNSSIQSTFIGLFFKKLTLLKNNMRRCNLAGSDFEGRSVDGSFWIPEFIDSSDDETKSESPMIEPVKLLLGIGMSSIQFSRMKT